MLDESQSGIKIARRNINNLSYADDTTLMAESEEELKNLLVTMKEEIEKTGLNFNIQNPEITAYSPITSRQIEGGNVKAVTDFAFMGSKITMDSDFSQLLARKTMANLDSVLKSRDTILLAKVHIVKVTVFPVVMYRCERWTIKKAECQRTDASEL